MLLALFPRTVWGVKPPPVVACLARAVTVVAHPPLTR